MADVSVNNRIAVNWGLFTSQIWNSHTYQYINCICSLWVSMYYMVFRICQQMAMGSADSQSKRQW